MYLERIGSSHEIARGLQERVSSYNHCRMANLEESVKNVKDHLETLQQVIDTEYTKIIKQETEELTKISSRTEQIRKELKRLREDVTEQLNLLERNAEWDSRKAPVLRGVKFCFVLWFAGYILYKITKRYS